MAVGLADLFPQIHSALVRLQGVCFYAAVIAQNQFCAGDVEISGGPECGLPLGEGADHQDLLPLVLTGVHIHLSGVFAVFLVVAVPDAGQLPAQGDGLPVEVQNGIGVLLLLGNIDFLVVLIDIKPRLSGGEA